MAKRTKAPKPIHIATLTDLVNTATPQNFELLMKDLALYVHSMICIKAVGVELKECAMEWTDDGKNELTGYDIKVRKS